MIVVDVVAYAALLALLFFMTRVSHLERVSVTIEGQKIPGTVLRGRFQLNSRVGLLNTPRLAAGDGIILNGGRSIHTVGMHFPIDVIFLDEMMRVVGWLESLESGRKRVKGPPVTRYVLELGAGTISQYISGLKLNAKVEVGE